MEINNNGFEKIDSLFDHHKGIRDIQPNNRDSIKEAYQKVGVLISSIVNGAVSETNGQETEKRQDVNTDNQANEVNESETSNKEVVEDNDSDDSTEKKGGRYADVRKGSDGEKEEVHHMPADSADDLLERNDGPSIKMDKEDHRETASCGNSKEAQEYRKKQRELIEQGKFLEALKMDIEDILEKFGDKYNEEIKEMLDYVKELVDKGIIKDEDGILDELYEMIGYGEDEK